MKLAAIWIVMLVCTSCSSVSPTQKQIARREANGPVLVVSSLKDKKGRPYLLFNLRNPASSDISVRSGELPWALTGITISIERAREEGAIPIRERLLLAHYVGTLTIRQGETVSERIYLHSWFEYVDRREVDWEREGREHGLRLRWTYRLRSADGQVWPSEEGRVEIPR
jgi:hypothetical protein